MFKIYCLPTYENGEPIVNMVRVITSLGNSKGEYHD